MYVYTWWAKEQYSSDVLHSYDFDNFSAVQMACVHVNRHARVHIHTHRHTHTHTSCYCWMTPTKLLHYVRWKNTRCKCSPKNIRKFL